MNIEEVLNHIDNRINQFNLSLTNKDGYLELRKLYNSEKNPLDLFVLVAYSFNHQIRFNNSHEFNNPFGKARSCFNEHMKNNLLDFLNITRKIPNSEISVDAYRMNKDYYVSIPKENSKIKTVLNEFGDEVDKTTSYRILEYGKNLGRIYLQ